jgi:hypothetical protein
MNSSVIDNLQANGYMAEFAHIDGVPHPQIVGAQHDYLISDFSTGQRQYMRDPTVSVAVLEFTVEEASLLAAKFAAELIKIIAPTDRLLKKYVRPLVRITPTSLHAVYQTDTHYVGLFDDSAGHRQMFEYGFAFPDANQYSTGNLRVACSGVLLDGGMWLNEASPLTVKCTALPTWNRDETAKKLRLLVDRFVSARELREREPYQEPRKQYENDTDGHADLYERAGIKVVYTDDDVPPPMQYADERLRKAFGVNIGDTPTGNGFAARRRG